MSTHFVACALVLASMIEATAQPLQFQPLVDDWMISEEVVLNDGPGGISDGLSEIRIATLGRDYLVAWASWSNLSSKFRIRVATVNQLGEAVGDSFELIQDTFSNSKPRTAGSRSGGAVTWLRQDSSGAYSIMAKLISADGTSAGSATVAVRQSSNRNIWEHEIARSTGGYLVVWRESALGDFGPRQTIYAKRLDSHGKVLDAEPILLSENEERLTYFPISISEHLNGFRVAPGSARLIDLSREGVFLNGSDAVPAAPGTLDSMTVASIGEQTFAVWRQGETLLGNWFQGIADVQFQEADISVVPADVNQYPKVVAGASEYLVYWRDRRNSLETETGAANETFGTRVDSIGNVMDPEGLNLAVGPRDTRWGHISASVTGYLFSFVDSAGTSTRRDDTIKAKLIIDPDRYLILSEPARTAEGAIEFQFNAAPGHSFAIEHTEDFAEWLELQQFNDFSGEAIVSDNPEGAIARFYRARRIVDGQ